MGSPFSGLTPELPSIVVDRVHLKLTTAVATLPQPVVPGADFLAFLTMPNGGPGSAIKIVERAEPISEAGDPGIALLLWAQSKGTGIEISGGRFEIGVGWRFLYPDPPRFREPGDPDSASLVWKLIRVLYSNQKLTDALGQDAKTDRIMSFKGNAYMSIDAAGNPCGEVLEGEVVYDKLLAKASI